MVRPPLLRTAERVVVDTSRTGTDTASVPVGAPRRRRTVNGGLWVAGANVVPLAGTFVLSVVVGRVLGPAELGLQSFIAYVSALLMAFLVGAQTEAAVRWLSARSGQGAETGPLVRATMIGHTAGGLLVAAVLVLIGSLQHGESALWCIVALTALVDSIAWAYNSRWVAFRGWSRPAAARLVTQSCSAVIATAAVFAGLGVAGVFGATLLASTGLLLALVHRVPGPRPATGPLPPGLLAAWGAFLALELVNQVVGRRIEFVFLGAFSTTAQVAMYSVPFMVVWIAIALPSSIFASAMPVIARRAAEAGVLVVSAQLGAAVRVVLACSVVLTGLVAGLGPATVLLGYGPSFREAAWLVPVLSVSVLSVPVGLLCQAFWIGVGQLRPVLLCGAAGGVLDLVLAGVLVPGEGALGASVANVTGQTVSALALLWHTRRALGRFRLNPRHLVAAAFASLAVAFAALALTARLPPWSALLLGLAVAAGVLAAVGRAVGFVDHEDGRWLTESLPAPLDRAAGLVVHRNKEVPA
jgi:O-antigen/teichoic acid export membrane protein